ncbi:MAG TPA: hypothetical protein VGM39_20440, partial [Kofleriaceae bacterium]
TYDMELMCSSAAGGCVARLVAPETFLSVSSAALFSGGVGLRARGALAVAFDYLDVIDLSAAH